MRESRRRLGKCSFFYDIVPLRMAAMLKICRWNEAELRTYQFRDGDDEAAMIYETDESLAKRGMHLQGGADRGEVKVNQPSRRGTLPNLSFQNQEEGSS